VKGDEIDRMLGEAMIKNACSVEISRISEGKYMFGTRQIIARIVNMKLLIRVGGGFMTIDEFIQQYGPIEMLKYSQSLEASNLISKGRKSNVGGSPSRTSTNVARNIASMRKSIVVGIS
jgi:hypothetical protein